MEIKLKLREESKTFLKNFPDLFRQSLKKGFRDAVLFLKSKVKKSFGEDDKPKIKSGALRRSIFSSIKERNNLLIGTLGSNLIYASIQEVGGVVISKKKFLNFTIENRWVKIQKVVIPARPYLQPTVEDNLTEAGDIITDRIEKDMR